MVDIGIGIHQNFNQYEARNLVTQNLSGAPPSPKEGQRYYDTGSKTEFFWNGTIWRPVDAGTLTDGSIKIAALAVDPRDRRTHTQQQLSSTISDFDAAVLAKRLDQFQPPTSDLNLNSQKITALAMGTANTDGVNVLQLNNAIQQAAAAIDSKPSVRVVATSNITLSGIQTLDGVSLAANDRVLAVGQATATQNGVYIAGNSTWARALDADQSGEITPGAFWYVEEGTAGGATQWRCSNTGTITLGTTNIVINQFGSAASYTASLGVQKVGNDFRAQVVSGGGLIVTVNGLQIDTASVSRKVAGTITGDGTTVAFNLVHNLGTQDILPAIRYSDGTYFLVSVVAVSNTTATFTFGLPPAVGVNIRLIVMG